MLISMDTNQSVLYGKNLLTGCVSQEKYRLRMACSSTLLFMVAVLTIFTMFAVILAGNHFIFWPFIIGGMGITLVVNLAALPTKITIPVFFFSVLMDLVIIISCIAIGFDASSTHDLEIS